MPRPCPCGRPRGYARCCGAYIGGERAAETAETLMRSRYTAYIDGAVDYLLRTTAARQRAAIDREELARYCATLRGVSLKIVETAGGREADSEGVVSFEATLRSAGRKFVQRERSRFAREDGRWVYVDGEVE